nr:4Fe-4S binding protein [Bacilli bacterium]
MAELVKFMIDGQEVEVEKGTTVLEAAKSVGIAIPTLCYLKGISQTSGCRVCLVEAGPKLLASCSLVAEPNMQIKTNTQKVRSARKTVVEFLLSNHKEECTLCSRTGNCELQSLSYDLKIDRMHYTGRRKEVALDDVSPSLVRDQEKCVLCGRCVAVCKNTQSVSAIGLINRGFETVVGSPFGRSLAESTCINCGQCIMVCPVGALQERESIDDVWDAIADPQKVVVVQTAPAVRVALGEEFGMPIGTRVTGKMVSALRMLGFDKVFDTDFGADLTIMEEGTELITRLTSGEQLPLMTSCCPGWVKFVEGQFPDLIPNLSSAKSPHEMEGAIIKSYFAKKMNVNPQDIVVVSIMPCVGKKYEQQREELSVEGMQDVDYVLTTRELARMIKQLGIDFVDLKEGEFDDPFGRGSGAGVIFGATGGVAEAALRTVYEILAGEELDTIEYTAVRGLDGIKENELELPNGQKIRTAVIHGLANARKVMDHIRKGEKNYDFIEVMACPGGCIAGGGQPIVPAKVRSKVDVRALRAKAIYAEDVDMPIRKSHKNPDIKRIYDEFLGEPNSHVAHELLHTHYKAKTQSSNE